MAQGEGGAYRPLAFATRAAAERAEQLHRAGRHVAAALQWQAVVRLDPTDIRAALRWADASLRAGQRPRAAEASLAAAAAVAATGEARRTMVLARRAHSLAPAELTRARLEPVVKCCGREAEQLCEIAAREHVAAGRFDAARELRELLADCDPISVTKKIDAAQIDLEHGDATRAEGHLVEAASRMHEAGRTGEYVRIAETMIAHGRHDPETTLELVRIYLRRGQVTEALNRLALLRRDAPSRLEVVELTVRCHAALGQTNAALCVLREAFTRGGHDTTMLVRLCDRVAAFDSRDPGFAKAVQQLRDDAPPPRRGPPPPPGWATRPTRPETPVVVDADDDFRSADSASGLPIL